MKKVAQALITAALGLSAVEIYWETHHFVQTEYVIRSEKLKGLTKEARILFFSDLHNHAYGAGEADLLAAARESHPDLILIGGDMVVASGRPGSGQALQLIRGLTEIAPVYYANGNHEQRAKEHPGAYCFQYADYRDTLTSCGVTFLSNASVSLSLGEVPVRLTGLEIPERCYTHFTRAPLYRADLYERIGKRDPDSFEILLAHNPAYMDTYVSWGADLILSGHLHGGVVGLPGKRGAITPDFRIFPPYCGGLYQKGRSSIVVSRGLGTHTVNLRLFDPAELILLRLLPPCQSGENPV